MEQCKKLQGPTSSSELVKSCWCGLKQATLPLGILAYSFMNDSCVDALFISEAFLELLVLNHKKVR